MLKQWKKKLSRNLYFNVLHVLLVAQWAFLTRKGGEFLGVWRVSVGVWQMSGRSLSDLGPFLGENIAKTYNKSLKNII